MIIGEIVTNLRGGARVSLVQPIPNTSELVSIHVQDYTALVLRGQGQEGLLRHWIIFKENLKLQT